MKKFEILQLKEWWTHTKGWEAWDDIREKFDINDYNSVYVSKCDDLTSLDSIYEKLNVNHPVDYKGRSLSVSDLILFPDDEKVFYVDMCGYVDISNRVYKTKEFELANDLVRFAQDYDWYDYMDYEDITTPDIIALDLAEGKITMYLDFLKDISSDESQLIEVRKDAEQLIKKLDELTEYKTKEEKNKFKIKLKENIQKQKSEDLKSSDFLGYENNNDKDYDKEK